MSKSLADQLKAIGLTQDKTIQTSDKKSLKKQIKSWVLDENLNAKDADTAYYFQHLSKAKKIYVTKAQLKQLSEGALAITVLDKKHYIITKALAEKINRIAPQYAVYLQEALEEDSDDPYKDYQVPDDLVW